MEKINILLENREVFRVSGLKCVEFLNNILTADLNKLVPNVITPCALLSPQGRILFDMLLSVNTSNDCNNYISINIECDKNQIDDLIQKINIYNLRREIEIEKTNYKVFVTNDIIHSSNVFNDKRFFNQNIIRVYDNDKTKFKTNSDENIYNFLRFKSCVLEGPLEILANTTLPSEINLDLLDGISFDKGCFIGQEVNARIKWKGLVKNKYVPIKFKYRNLSNLNFDEIEDKRLLLNEIEIGELVSITQNTIKDFFYGIAKVRLSKLYLFENDDNLKCNLLQSKVSIIFPEYMLPLPKKI